MGSVYLRGKTYWLKYYRNGKPIRESSGNRKKSVAVALLREREGRIAQGLPLSMKVEKMLFDELAEDYLNDYRINAKRSLDRAERSVRRLYLSPFQVEGPFLLLRRTYKATPLSVRQR